MDKMDKEDERKIQQHIEILKEDHDNRIGMMSENQKRIADEVITDFIKDQVENLKAERDTALARAEKAEGYVKALHQLALDAFDAFYWMGVDLRRQHERDDGTKFALMPLYNRLDPLSILMRATNPDPLQSPSA